MTRLRHHVTAQCGIHVTRTYPCAHCARAAVTNAAALADVVQKPAEAGPRWRFTTPPDVTARVLRGHEEGETLTAIARAENISPATVSRIVGEKRTTNDDGRRAAIPAVAFGTESSRSRGSRTPPGDPYWILRIRLGSSHAGEGGRLFSDRRFAPHRGKPRVLIGSRIAIEHLGRHHEKSKARKHGRRDLERRVDHRTDQMDPHEAIEVESVPTGLERPRLGSASTRA